MENLNKEYGVTKHTKRTCEVCELESPERDMGRLFDEDGSVVWIHDSCGIQLIKNK